MPADYSYFVALEPNHDVVVDEEGYQIVLCPFVTLADGSVEAYRTPVTQTATWSPNAGPDEVNCPQCEVFNGELHFAGAPDHGGEHGPEIDPPVAGGAHGGTHHISEYAPCKVPLRRIEWCGVTVVCHEGIVADLGYVEDVWESHGGADWYEIRQADTAVYVCRRVRGGSSWSGHSWGVCPDVNWQTNPFRTRRCDHPRALRAAFKARGFAHGLDWKSSGDPMHYSKLPREGGDGVLYNSFRPKEDGFMSALSDEEQREALRILRKLDAFVFEDDPQKVKTATGRGPIVGLVTLMSRVADKLGVKKT